MATMTRISAARAALGALCLLTACGGGSPSAPASVAGTPASPAASPSPSPSPSPTPVPESTPTPNPAPSPEINDNDAPVFRVAANVYYVDCDGKILEHSRNMEEIPCGCRAHLDATAKDEDGVPTNPRYTVRWQFGNPDALDIRGSNPMGPIVTARFPHAQEIYIHVDGIDSNKFFVRFN
jgi:hypothetical protein